MTDQGTSDVVHRKLTALLSADAVGYSRLMTRDEAAALRTLSAHREVMGRLVLHHGGRVVDAVGDNLLADLPSVVDAVACAIRIQQELEARNGDLPAAQQMPFRIGIHLGDVVVEGERLYGDGVNIAARLEALAEPGGICISGTVYEQVRHKLSQAYEDLGEQTLKNISDPVRVYRVRWTEGASADDVTALSVPGFGGRPAIAVLPFDNLSRDPEQEYFADGIAEDLITRLSAVRSFPVIARNSSFVYKGKAVDVKRVSRELGVRYVVEGSVRKAGNRVRISAQLIDATTGHHLWADRYDRELDDIFTLQDEIVETIVRALELTLGRVERERAVRRAPQNLDAWECVQRGWWHFFHGTRDELLAAQSWFRKAAELDPHFSLAFGSLAISHMTLLAYQWSETPAQSLADGLQAAERGVALGEDEPRAQFALGVACVNAGRHERAVAALERVLELNPSFASAYWGLGVALSHLGRPDEAVALIEKAIRLSPHDPVMHEFLYSLGVAHFVAGRYDEAIAWEKKSLQEKPEQPGAYRVLAASYGYLNRTEEARAALEAMRRLVPGFSLETLRLHVPSVLVDRYVEGWRKAGWTG